MNYRSVSFQLFASNDASAILTITIWQTSSRGKPAVAAERVVFEGSTYEEVSQKFTRGFGQVLISLSEHEFFVPSSDVDLWHQVGTPYMHAAEAVAYLARWGASDYSFDMSEIFCFLTEVKHYGRKY